MTEKFRLLAAVIAAHPDGTVFGRTRLQKTVKLLQRLGVPLDYDYMIHFYGPYSEGVQADVGLLENLRLVEEEERMAKDGSKFFVLRATDEAARATKPKELRQYQGAIDVMSGADAVVLELAATYDAFRAEGDDHQTALQRLRRKKGTKCNGKRVEKALGLLKQLEL